MAALSLLHTPLTTSEAKTEEEVTTRVPKLSSIDGATSGVGTNEVAMRNQHKAWADYMAGS